MPTQKDYLQEWEAIVNASDLRVALTDHFSYLAEESMDSMYLDTIMSRAERATFDKNKLVIYFKGIDELLIATPPLINIPEQYPAKYKSLLSKHRSIEFFVTFTEEDSRINIDDLGKLGDYPFRKKGNGLPYLFFIHQYNPRETHPQGDGTAFLEKVAITFNALFKGRDE